MTTISDPSAMTPDDPRWLSWFMQQRRFDRLSRKAQTGASLITDFASGVYEMGYPGQRRGNYELSDIVKVSRSTGGGIINQLGQFEWVGNDVPRLTYDPVTLQPLGLLVEEQRTNLLLQSGNPALAPWTYDSVTLGPPAAGPLGNETPVYETAVSGFFRVRQQASSVVAGVAYTYKFNIKKLGRRYLFIRTQARTIGNENIGFDLDTLTTTFVPAGWTASIRIVSPGIYQLTATCTALTTNGVVHGVLASNAPITTNTLPNYVGDPAQGFVYVSGQFEAGASPSSDIPTAASQVIRAADVPVVNTLAPWYNPLAGTFKARAAGIIGQAIVTAGTAIILADSASMKNYSLSYSVDPSATSLVIGKGIISSISYFPRSGA